MCYGRTYPLVCVTQKGSAREERVTVTVCCVCDAYISDTVSTKYPLVCDAKREHTRGESDSVCCVCDAYKYE